MSEFSDVVGMDGISDHAAARVTVLPEVLVK